MKQRKNDHIRSWLVGRYALVHIQKSGNRMPLNIEADPRNRELRNVDLNEEKLLSLLMYNPYPNTTIEFEQPPKKDVQARAEKQAGKRKPR